MGQWQGTRDLSAFLTVPTAIEFQRRHDWDRVRARCHALAAQTLARVGELTGLGPICRDADFAQMVAIPVPPMEPVEPRTVTRRASTGERSGMSWRRR